jgi:hypothetical protein
MRRASAGVLAVAVVLLAGGCTGQATKTGPKRPEPEKPAPGKPSGDEPALIPPVEASPAAKDPAFKLAAEDLAKEILADEAGARSKYEGKAVELTGVVLHLNQWTTRYYLSGARKRPEDEEKLNLECQPASEGKAKPWPLAAGQKVKVTGRLLYVNTLRTTLEGCTFTALTPSPVHRLTAEGLAGEYVKSVSAARKKYTGPGASREMLITGVITGTEPPTEGDQGGTVYLAGHGGVTVSCYVPKDAIASLKKGDEVTVRGELSHLSQDEKVVAVTAAVVVKKE